MKRRQALQGLAALGMGATLSGFTWPFRTGIEQSSLMIAGATAMVALSRDLARAFAAVRPDVELVVEGGGVLAGLVAVKRGGVDIAAMTRLPDRYEETADTRTYIIGKDALVFHAHASCGVSTTSLSAIRRLFMGQVTNWKELGGAPVPVHPLHMSRDASAEFHAFRELVLDADDIPDEVGRVADGDAMTKALRLERGSIGTIGYFSFHRLPQGMAPLAVEGILPSRGSVLSGSYPLTRPFYYVVQGAPRPEVAAFLDFVRSPPGQDIVERHGLMRVY